MNIFKLIFLTVAILASFTATAQDGYNQTSSYYNQVESEVIGIDVNKVIQFSLDVTENLETQYTYYRRSISDRKLSIVYQSDLGGEDLVLTFSVNKPSADDSLFAEKSNIQKITGSQESLIAIWQHYFLKNATRKQILENANYRVLRDQKDFLKPNATGLHFWLVFKDGFGVIENRN